MRNFQEKDFTDILRVQGVNAKGYGIIPKMVMQDTRLSIQAKAIYAYLCSYAGSGDTAFPSILKIKHDLGIKDTHTITKHRKHLEKYGYIQFEQQKKENGVFGTNIYTLISHPTLQVVDNTQKIDNDNTVNTACENFTHGTVCENIRHGFSPCRMEPHTNNNRSLNINRYSNNNTHTDKLENTTKIEVKAEEKIVCVDNSPSKIDEKPSITKTEELQKEIRKVTEQQLSIKKISELLTVSSLERIKFHLDNWHIHKQHQKSEGAGWFITVIENDITPEKKKAGFTGEKEKIPHRDNFEQREYTREQCQKWENAFLDKLVSQQEQDRPYTYIMQEEQNAPIIPSVKDIFKEPKNGNILSSM